MKLKWKREKPSAEGWYWLLWNGTLGIIAVNHGELAPEAYGCWGTFSTEDITENENVWYAGPIPEPES
jgi:hypothetical protein